MNYYVLRPDLTPYEGIKVDKDTKLKFENESVSQEIKNLKLTTIRKEETDKYKLQTKLTIFLKKGDILLFEKENRGYFLPAEPIGKIKTAINDYKCLATALDHVNYELEK